LHTDALFYTVGILFNIKTINGYLAAGFVAQGLDNFKGCGFTGTIRAKQSEYLALVNLEANILYGLKIALVLYQVFYGNNGLFCHSVKMRQIIELIVCFLR